MRVPRISDSQLDLLAARLAAIGVGRRDFLRVAAGLATMGAAGFNARPVSAAPKLAPGEKLAKEQHLRFGGGELVRPGPVEPRLQQGPLLRRHAAALGRAHEVQRELRGGALRRREGHAQQGRLGLDVRDSQGLEVVRRRAVHGPGFRVLVEAPARPGQRGPVRVVPLRHQERRGVQQEAADRREGGRRPGQGRLDARGDPRGPARLLPGPVGLSGGAARSSRLDRKVRRQVDGGREHRLQRALRAGRLGAQQGHRPEEEQALLRRQGRHPGEGDDPDHPDRLRRAAVREQRDRSDAAADRRPQAVPVRSRRPRRKSSDSRIRAPGISCHR